MEIFWDFSTNYAHLILKNSVKHQTHPFKITAATFTLYSTPTLHGPTDIWKNCVTMKRQTFWSWHATYKFFVLFNILKPKCFIFAHHFPLYNCTHTHAHTPHVTGKYNSNCGLQLYLRSYTVHASVTRGNNYKLVPQHCRYNLQKYYLTNRAASVYLTMWWWLIILMYSRIVLINSGHHMILFTYLEFSHLRPEG